MAMQATARRSDLSAKPRADLERPTSPTRNRDTTPRPSISPLSAKASPVIARNASMQEGELGAPDGVDNVPVASTAEDRDEQDDRSSSLSEPGDDDEDEEEGYRANGIVMAGSTAEQLSAQQSLDVDSEAETERLDQTPQKLRQQAETINKTPSKLSHGATADEELSEPPSPLPTGPGAASSTGTIETANKKRKRSETAESSLTSADSHLGESPRKRSHSSTTADKPNLEEAVEEISADATDQHADLAEDAESREEAVDIAQVAPVKKRKGGRPPKNKGKKSTQAETEPEVEQQDDSGPTEVQSEEALAKSAEEVQHKPAASTAFDDLAKQFSAYREKLFNERIAAVDQELEMLNRKECDHPEYLRQVASVDTRRDKQKREARAFYRFKLDSLRRTTLGERSQLHSQYFQHARDLRENVMYQLGEDWYKIQKERRQSNQETDDAFVYKFPTKKSVQIKQQAKYNQEVSVLSGIAKYVGFPAAPEISGAEGDALEDDLKAMKISKRPQQATSQPPPVYFPNRAGLIQPQSDRIAQEQFMEQNAWARPQAPIHNHGTPNLTHTPDWAAEPVAQGTKGLLRNVSGGIHRVSPYATPMPQRRTAAEQQSSSGTVPANSDPTEPPSSVQAAPPTTDRMQHSHFSRDQGSPLAVLKHRQNGPELTGFRNISNISGASTIDAVPSSAEKERERIREHVPGIPKEPPPASQHILTTGAFQRHLDGQRHDVYANASFRPQEGTFGTPAPLSQPSTAP